MHGEILRWQVKLHLAVRSTANAIETTDNHISSCFDQVPAVNKRDLTTPSCLLAQLPLPEPAKREASGMRFSSLSEET